MPTLILNLCTICENAERQTGVTRCSKCQNIFNAIRTKNPGAITKEKRVAPTVNQLRAALGMPPRPERKLKSAGHTAKRERVSDDPEYLAALGYVKDVQAQQEGKQGYVYCIAEVPQGGGLHYCKVGFSTNPQARVPELQTGNPRPLKLLCCKEGTLEDEAALHAQYLQANVLQEWFVVSRALLLEFDLDPELNPYPTEDGKAIE